MFGCEWGYGYVLVLTFWEFHSDWWRHGLVISARVRNVRDKLFATRVHTIVLWYCKLPNRCRRMALIGELYGVEGNRKWEEEGRLRLWKHSGGILRSVTTSKYPGRFFPFPSPVHPHFLFPLNISPDAIVSLAPAVAILVLYYKNKMSPLYGIENCCSSIMIIYSST